MILATRTTMKTTLLFMQHSLLTQTRYISRPALSFGVAGRRRNSIPSFNAFTLRLQLERSTKPALLLQTQAYSGKGSHNDHKKIVALQHSYIFASNPDVKKKDVIGPLQGQSKRNAHAVSANKSKKQKNSKQKKINKSRSEKLCVSGKKIEKKSNSVLESVIKEISSIKKSQKQSLLKTDKKEMVKNDACKTECTKIPGEDLQGCSNKKQEGISTVEGKGKGKSKSFGNDLPGDDSLSEKDVALREALTQISSNFGKEAIMWLGRFNGSRNVPAISTGSVSLDVALGIGGLPKGRVVEIYGPEASGKTTLSLHVIAESQRNGGYCAFIDAEHALDPTLAESIGVDTNNLLLAQPDCGEQALSVVDTLVRCGSVDVVVIDSVAALVPKSELEGEMGDAHMALQARLMSQALRKLTPSLARSQTLVIFTNQIRHKLSTFGGSFGGPAEVTAGGNALKFYASVRLNVRRIGYIKKGDQVTGSQVLIKVVKNKLAPPLKTAELEIEFGRGISSEAEVLDLGCKQGLITKSGSFYTINEHRVHGKDAAKEYLKENEEVKYALCSEIKENLFHASNDNINGKEGDIENTDETASSPNTDTSESDEVAETEIASVA